MTLAGSYGRSTGTAQCAAAHSDVVVGDGDRRCARVPRGRSVGIAVLAGPGRSESMPLTVTLITVGARTWNRSLHGPPNLDCQNCLASSGQSSVAKDFPGNLSQAMIV